MHIYLFKNNLKFDRCCPDVQIANMNKPKGNYRNLDEAQEKKNKMIVKTLAVSGVIFMYVLRKEIKHILLSVSVLFIYVLEIG